MKKIAFVLACILTISICLAGCQETEFDTGEGTPVFSLDANEISAVTFQNGNTGEKTIVSNRDEITEIADYLNAFRYTETQSVRGGDGWSSRIIIDFNEGESISFYSLEAGKIIMDDTEYILTSSEEGKVFDLEYNDEEPNTAPTGETEDIEEDPSLVTNNEGQLISEFLDLDHTYSEDDVHIKFGLPQRTLSGFWGDVFVLEDGTEIIVYYDNDGLVDQVMTGAAAKQTVVDLKKKNAVLEEEKAELKKKIPSVHEKMEAAAQRSRLESQNRQLWSENEELKEALEEERSFSDRLLEGIDRVLDMLERHLPKQLLHLVDKARDLLPEHQTYRQEKQHERGHSWGDMSL